MGSRLDHIAVATRDPEKLKKILHLLELKEAGIELVADQGVKTHFLKAATGQPNVEILEPVDVNGVVSKFIDRKGAGIHHLAFDVTGISGGLEALSKTLRENGIRLIYEKSRVGAHNKRINFIHPDSSGGVLIEIAEQSP